MISIDGLNKNNTIVYKCPTGYKLMYVRGTTTAPVSITQDEAYAIIYQALENIPWKQQIGDERPEDLIKATLEAK